MVEIFGGIVGGLGLFIVGMWLLTENLKQLASRRLRETARRWTANRLNAVMWGTVAGGVSQSMTALTFVVVSILRSGLITTQGAIAIILGGWIGTTTLVMIVTFDLEAVSLYVLGITGAVVVSERWHRYRSISASLLGGSMLFFGLFLLKESAAPLADEPWFRDMVVQTGGSLALTFLVGAVLTAIVQSSSAVSVFGISLATVGITTVDQTIMLIYGTFIGSSLIVYLLSSSLAGRSRQIAMFTVFANIPICIVVVSLFYAEVYFGIPSMKAAISAFDFELDQQLALLFFLYAVVPVPIILALLGPTTRVVEKLWPASQADEVARLHFIHDRAAVDIDSSLLLIDLEQKRVFKLLSRYFESARQYKDIAPLRDAVRAVMSDIGKLLTELQASHTHQGVEVRNSLMIRLKLLGWLEDAVAVLCKTLIERSHRQEFISFKSGVCEGVDGVLLCMIDAMDSDDEQSWGLVSQLTGDRGSLMRKMRFHYMETSPPLQQSDLVNVLRITNAVEEIFFLISRLEADYNPHADHEARPQRSENANARPAS